MDPLLGSEFHDRGISGLRVMLTVMEGHTTKPLLRLMNYSEFRFEHHNFINFAAFNANKS